MRIQFEHENFTSFQVSIILLDWSCRESFHILHYLNNQTIPREKYEIIWIEYYDRKVREIEKSLEDCHRSNSPPLLDKWITMDMPNHIYYHKHLMYNIGIIACRGSIITICDSDAVVSPTFVESIARFFEKEISSVLHMDQIRSIEPSFYPFNYPSIEEIIHSRCTNLVDGKPKGLVDKSLPLHSPNYGACFSASREDIIQIGGADEHIDYLGHICGPYEMTFRLKNAGKKEVWHPEEWLYHAWHPGQSGDDNYAGPHDGRHMSQTALSIRRTGRVFPLVENQAIEMLRLEKDKNISEKDLLNLSISGIEKEKWFIDRTKYNKARYRIGDKDIRMKERESCVHQEMKNMSKNPIILLKLITLLIMAFARESYDKIFFIKHHLNQRNTVSMDPLQKWTTSVEPKFKGFSQIIEKGFRFLKRFLRVFKRLFSNDSYIIGRCAQCLKDLKSMGVNQVVLFGDRSISGIFSILSEEYSIKIKAIYQNDMTNSNIHEPHYLKSIKKHGEKIIITSFDDVENKTALLVRAGIGRNMIVDLW